MTRAADIYYKLSPLSLIAIVMLNFLLIYLNLVNLENQSQILKDIQENTEIALQNQELGLNASAQNQKMLETILSIETLAGDIFEDVSNSEPLGGNRTN